MNLGRYQLLAQVGAGTDGASYRAADAAGAPVELRLLGGARADGGRWPTLARKLRLAAMLEHPALIAVRELALDHDPPFVALEWVEGTRLGEAKATPADALPVGRALASALAGAHRLGLVHGRLRPSTIRRTADGAVKFDLTGVEAGAAAPAAEQAEIDTSCQAPELAEGGTADSAADLYALGAILYWLLQGRPYRRGSAPEDTHFAPAEETAVFGASWQTLLPALLAEEPADRPSARLVEDQLGQNEGGAFRVRTKGESGGRTDATPQRVGRFRLLEKMGEGGMGTVYRAEDVTDGTVVALKLIQGRWDDQEAAWRRLRKEARLLAEVNNPYVANLIEVNEHEGVPYLVLEFVAGQSLGKVLAARRRLDEPTALAVMADVARALVDAHRRGIVHRDVKPENILLQMGNGEWGMGDEKRPEDPSSFPIRVKLCDFGLARHVLQTESLNVTHAGAVVGTPFYSSPEQCAGKAVDVRSDVYSLGATLFHVLAGRPPFLGDTILGLSALHANEPPPPLRKLNPDVSDGICRIVERALAKNPEARQSDAEAFLLDLERLRRGEPVEVVVHPRLPVCAPGKLLQYDWTWDLEASPGQLWPHVSNTERLNHAVGLPAVQFSTEPDPTGGSRRFGVFRKAGFVNAWREHPFEWVEGRRLGVLREYSQGVFKWLASVVELKPRAGGGTTLTHTVRIEPRGLVGRMVAAMEVGAKGRRALERVYRRIDAFVTGKLGGPAASDPFEQPAAPRYAGRQRLERLLDRLIELRVDPAVVEKLGEHLLHAPPQEVARVRPLALARRLGLDPEQVVDACLHGAREGLLVLLWDILCPICRIPAGVKETLRALSEHEHCPACELDFPVDFANAVELIFRVHPQIRSSELGVYCIGGPAHSPHVAAQVRVAAGETVALDLTLPEGAYKLRGPQLPYALDFQVRPKAPGRRWDLRLARGPAPEIIPALQTGRQRLALTNDHPHELVVRVERTANRDDALTAARASTLALFRELFPEEALSPGQLVSVAAMTLLVADLDPSAALYQQLGDARAFGVLHDLIRQAGEAIKREGGAIVKTVGEGLLAAFLDPTAAVRVGLELAERVVSGQAAGLRLRVGLHRGPVLAATIDGRLDYFGATVSQTTRLPALAQGGEVVLTQPLATDPSVAALLQERGLTAEVLPAAAERFAGFLHRIAFPSRSSG